ncbi:MAG: hypothetical protein QMD09_12770 [Desulfatibacillaceae bacterium]|nr:hypothetical protein [Desulfatibacillaceae bacterium]
MSCQRTHNHKLFSESASERLALCFFLTVIVLWASMAGVQAGSETPAKILVQGETAYFTGYINGKNSSDFMQAVRGKNIRTVVLNSTGGEINAGMDMGLWIFENKVDVVIDGLCMSSCANYLFVAGRNKTLLPGSVVAWHGSAMQSNMLSRGQVEEQLRQAIGGKPIQEPEFEALVEQTWDYMVKSREKQAAFFSKIGVDENICRIGSEEFDAEDFFTMSIDDMARFGVKNVHAPQDYPPDLTELSKHKPIVHIRLSPVSEDASQ